MLMKGIMERNRWQWLLLVLLMTAFTVASCSKDSDGDEGVKLEVSPTSIDLDASGVAIMNISSNTTWSVSTSVSWLALSTLSGTGNAQVTITAAGDPANRSAIITVKAEGVTRQVAVTQTANGTPTTPTTPTDPTATKGTLTNPYTVKEARAIADALSPGTKGSACYVKGVIKEIRAVTTPFDFPGAGYAHFDIADTLTESTTLFANSSYYLQNKTFSSKDQIVVSDHVVMYGTLAKSEYRSAEIVDGYIYSLNGETKPEAAQNTETTSPDGSVITFTVSGVTFKMKRVDGGTFQMGATEEQITGSAQYNEQPVHRVTLNTFFIGETEVTQALWYAIMAKSPDDENSWYFGSGADYPAYHLSWNLCQEFITKLNRVTGRQFRFPTEAEWEFAARGGTKSRGYKYAGSDNVDDVAWYQVVTPSAEHLHPVATKKANELGLYDMSGNAREWCSDWYDYYYYKSSPSSNPTGPTTGEDRVRRGGSIAGDADQCRVACRSYSEPSSDTYPNGLRLALQQ